MEENQRLETTGWRLENRMWNTGSRQTGPYWLPFGDIAGSLVWSHICSVKCKVLSCALLLGCQSLNARGWVDGCSLLYLGLRTDGWNYVSQVTRSPL